MCLHIFYSSDELQICQRQILGRTSYKAAQIVPPRVALRELVAFVRFVQVHVLALVVAEEFVIVKENTDFALAAFLSV